MIGIKVSVNRDVLECERKYLVFNIVLQYLHYADELDETFARYNARLYFEVPCEISDADALKLLDEVAPQCESIMQECTNIGYHGSPYANFSPLGNAMIAALRSYTQVRLDWMAKSFRLQKLLLGKPLELDWDDWDDVDTDADTDAGTFGCSVPK